MEQRHTHNTISNNITKISQCRMGQGMK